jgi:hypothetical protein
MGRRIDCVKGKIIYRQPWRAQNLKLGLKDPTILGLMTPAEIVVNNILVLWQVGCKRLSEAFDEKLGGCGSYFGCRIEPLGSC